MTNAAGHTPPGAQPDAPSTGAAVGQILLGGLAAVLLLLFIPLGLFEVGMLTMASDSCGSDNPCSKIASFAMLSFGAGGPIIVLVTVLAVAITRSLRDRLNAWALVSILWCGVAADVACIIAGYVAAGAIDPH